MTRLTVDIDDELLAAAQEVLGTTTKVATINAALREQKHRRDALRAVELLASIKMDFSGSENAWRFGGGRDLSPEALAEAARQGLERD